MFCPRAGRIAIWPTAASLATAQPTRADLEVVASIKPIHSLVAGVMEGDLAPHLIVDGPASPHTFSLRPSSARALERADVIFWVGRNLEPFLEKSIESRSGKAAVVTLIEAPNVDPMPFREGAMFEADIDADDPDGRENEEEATLDPHIWLDPARAQMLVRAIAQALTTAAPEHAPLYAANAQKLQARIEMLSAEIDTILSPVRERSFFVFHDGYRYMERRYGLEAAGSITVSPDALPSAGRVRDIRDKIRSLDATCVFSEPQFSPKLVDVVTADTSAKTGVLDPLGVGIPAGPDHYFTLMRDMAASMRDCLSPNG